MDASYDAENATYIRLSDDSVEVRGLGATAVDGTVSVSAAGTYVVSGSIADGRIVVEAGDEDKVQIVLSNASVCSQDGPAISILSADKCFVTLEQDSTNALVDGSAYTLEEGADEPNAALYSKADLTLNGAGSLPSRAIGSMRYVRRTTSLSPAEPMTSPPSKTHSAQRTA